MNKEINYVLKLGKLITRLILILLIIFGFFAGTFGGMADSGINEQRKCMIYGYSIALNAIIAIICLGSNSMKFKLKTRKEMVFYTSTIITALLFIIATVTL